MKSRFSLQLREIKSDKEKDIIFEYYDLFNIGTIPCRLKDSISGISYDAYLFGNPDGSADLAFNDIDDLLNPLLSKENVQQIIDNFAYSLRDTFKSEQEKAQFDCEVAKIKLERIISSK